MRNSGHLRVRSHHHLECKWINQADGAIFAFLMLSQSRKERKERKEQMTLIYRRDAEGAEINLLLCNNSVVISTEGRNLLIPGRSLPSVEMTDKTPTASLR